MNINLPEGISESTPVGNGRTVGDALNAIQHFDTSDIRDRLIDSGEIPAEEVDESIGEWRKFVACIVIARATGAGSVGMMSKKIDEVWHNAILFTREYFTLSEKLFGVGVYLHHAPVTKKDIVADAPVKNVFAEIYHQLFGMIPKIWGVLYENSLLWQDAMQGICTVNFLQHEADCNGVCHPGTCNGGDGQLCSNIPLKAQADCQAVCHPDTCKGCSGQLCSNIPVIPVISIQ